jgi:hypothetical protein
MPMTDEERRAKAAQKAREWRLANPEREKATKKAYREADPERWQAMRQAAHARYAEKNREKMRATQNAKRERLRAEAIVAYGSRCACPGCHVHHAELLTIDHTNGDGAEHRKALGRGSRDLYAWLQKNGYPDSFQLLCGSCNLAKSNKPQCPLFGQEH